MSIKKVVTIIFSCCFGLLLLGLGCSFVLRHSLSELVAEEQNYNVSFDLASELRASSTGLTTNARMYALTGFPRYKAAYQAIAGIRSGEIARPVGYGAGFWSMVPDDVQGKLTPAGEKIPLLTLMQQQGFTPDEMSLAEKAEQMSEQLSKREELAISAVDGNITPEIQREMLPGETPRAFARRILTDSSYIHSTSEIMQVLDQAQQKIDARLNDSVATTRAHAFWMGTLQIVLMLLLTASLVYVIYYTIRKICQPILEITAGVSRSSSGKLHIREVHVDVENELKGLADTINDLIRQVKQFVQAMRSNLKSLNTSTNQMSGSMEASANASQSMAGNISEAAAASEKETNSLAEVLQNVNSMKSQMDDVASDINHIVTASQSAAQASTEGAKVASDAVNQISSLKDAVATAAKTMEVLGKRSQQIGEIVETISGIANQTNLLSLNAAIEAARAGEQGRGFAVVAEEVRKLAEESQSSAKSISDLIGGIQRDTLEAVESVRAGSDKVSSTALVIQTTGTAFEQIRKNSQNIVQLVDETETCMKELTEKGSSVHDEAKKIESFSANVSGRMQSLAASSEEQSASAEEIAASLRDLSALAKRVEEEVSKFSIS